jgi:hypothetical protein
MGREGLEPSTLGLKSPLLYQLSYRVGCTNTIPLQIGPFEWRDRVCAPHAVASFIFLEPSHWIMQSRQFANLKRRAERAPMQAVHSTPAVSPEGG